MPFIDTPETNALKSKVEKILSEIPDFTDENKNLKINVIKDCADNGNAKLLEPLLKNAQTKKVFFSPVLDSFVFLYIHLFCHHTHNRYPGRLPFSVHLQAHNL